jgi:hypothetical protein
MFRLSCVLATLASVAVLIGPPVGAAAHGTARVRQSDGSERRYDVTLQALDHRAIQVTSADGRGTLTIRHAACSYVGALERCLPYGLVWHQAGATHDITLQRGSEYLNRTDQPQPLPFSSRRVPAHGITLLVLTARGTYITISGSIDEFRQ